MQRPRTSTQHLLLVLALAAAACSADNDETPQDGDASSSSTTTPQDPASTGQETSTTTTGPATTSGGTATTDAGSSDTTAGEETGSESTTSQADTSSTGDERPPRDANYPHPEEGCPPGTYDISVEVGGDFPLCSPACDLDAPDFESACPQPETGTAPGRCLFLGFEDGGPCDEKGAACPAPGQFCVAAVAGGFFCGDGIGCVPDCRDGQTCPDGMSCDEQFSTCIYD